MTTDKVNFISCLFGGEAVGLLLKKIVMVMLYLNETSGCQCLLDSPSGFYSGGHVLKSQPKDRLS